MFVRFRQSKYRLDVSVVATSRVDGKVKHDHIGSLGSVEVPLTVATRCAFWARAHRRLDHLSNRIDEGQRYKILGALHARIPMPTIEEQQALKRDNATKSEKFWSAVRDMHAATVQERTAQINATERQISESKAEMAKAAAEVDEAKSRLERLARGEDVPGGLFSKLLTRKDFERIVGRERTRLCIQAGLLTNDQVDEWVPCNVAVMSTSD
jgi:hypothetical protein